MDAALGIGPHGLYGTVSSRGGTGPLQAAVGEATQSLRRSHPQTPGVVDGQGGDGIRRGIHHLPARIQRRQHVETMIRPDHP